MRIIYPHPMEFPNKKAHSIQIINTCWALADKGVEVIFMVSKLGKGTIKECLDFYGLSEHPNLYVKGSTKKKGIKKFNLFVIHEVWKYRKDEKTVLFLRDKKLARLLILFRWFLKMPSIVETHSPYYRVILNRLSQEKNKVERFHYKFRVWQHKNLEKFLCKSANGIICTTEQTREIINKDFFISCPVEVICNATRILGKEFENKGSDILYLGQLYPQKGVDILIEALKYLPQRKLIIIGGNKKEDVQRIKELANEIGVSERTTFIGYVIPKEIGKYFSRVGVGVIPIFDTLGMRFTSPLKLFEYMAAKIPIVASNLPAIREILDNGHIAVLVEPNNPMALAEGIEKILSDREFARRISEKAYEKVKDFSYEKRAERIIGFIQNILNNIN